MTRSEANTLLTIVEANYRNAFKSMDNQSRRLLAQSWAIALHDIPVEIVLLAFFQLLSKSKWPPTVAEIREQAGHMYYEAEDLLRQTSFMETLSQYSASDAQKDNSVYMEELKIIAQSIIQKTEHLSRGLHGDDNSLKLNTMINAALLADPADSKELRALIIPRDVLPESGYMTNNE